MSHPLPPKTLSLKNRVRFVTATSLFDGHDEALNARIWGVGSEEQVSVIHVQHVSQEEDSTSHR